MRVVPVVMRRWWVMAVMVVRVVRVVWAPRVWMLALRAVRVDRGLVGVRVVGVERVGLAAR